MSDGLLTLVGLLGAMAMGPSNAGTRKDGKLCTAQPGECRDNRRYYSPGMRDAKSWSMPCADETCPDCCPYLRDEYRDGGTEEERRGRAFGMIDALNRREAEDRAIAALALGMMGLDPRDYLDDV